MIPPEKAAAVTRGLRQAFDVTGFEDIRRMTKGRTSALVFRVVVKGTPFLLRIVTQTNSMLGPERQFACMRAAADAGLAPRIRYASLDDQIAITDFVEEVPFPVTEALVRMPRMLRALHALSPFPEVVNHLNTTCMFLMNEGPALADFIRKFQAANVLSKSESEELFSRYAELAAVYPRLDREMASSHNDLFKPDNILFDGRRVWLVDWEAAFFNDRYVDLAVVANMIVTNDAEEQAYLREYFGQPPDEYQLARLFLMRQVARMFYAMVFLPMGSSDPPENRTESEPGLREFQRRYWKGEISLTDHPKKAAYGRFNWERLLEDTRDARFNEALKIVSGRPRENRSVVA